MFNGIWLVATEPLTIGGRDVQAGEQFHISRVHSGALLVQRKATIAHPQPGPKTRAAEPPPPAKPRRGRPRKTETKAAETVETPAPVSPEPPVIAEPVETPAVNEPFVEGNDADTIDIPRRRYHRRDLEAEE